MTSSFTCQKVFAFKNLSVVPTRTLDMLYPLAEGSTTLVHVERLFRQHVLWTVRFGCVSTDSEHQTLFTLSSPLTRQKDHYLK